MSVRFMPDGRLKTEAGAMLDGGPRMSSQDATLALGAATRVLLNSYPHTQDLTSDPARVVTLLADVTLAPPLEGHSARLFRGGSERVLVIEHHH